MWAWQGLDSICCSSGWCDLQASAEAGQWDISLGLLSSKHQRLSLKSQWQVQPSVASQWPPLQRPTELPHCIVWVSNKTNNGWKVKKEKKEKENSVGCLMSVRSIYWYIPCFNEPCGKLDSWNTTWWTNFTSTTFKVVNKRFAKHLRLPVFINTRRRKWFIFGNKSESVINSYKVPCCSSGNNSSAGRSTGKVWLLVAVGFPVSICYRWRERQQCELCLV